jgi:hypothetical protein
VVTAKNPDASVSTPRGGFVQRSKRQVDLDHPLWRLVATLDADHRRTAARRAPPTGGRPGLRAPGRPSAAAVGSRLAAATSRLDDASGSSTGEAYVWRSKSGGLQPSVGMSETLQGVAWWASRSRKAVSGSACSSRSSAPAPSGTLPRVRRRARLAAAETVTVIMVPFWTTTKVSAGMARRARARIVAPHEPVHAVRVRDRPKQYCRDERQPATPVRRRRSAGR